MCTMGTLTGDPTRTCENGVWSGMEPTCDERIERKNFCCIFLFILFFINFYAIAIVIRFCYNYRMILKFACGKFGVL